MTREEVQSVWGKIVNIGFSDYDKLSTDQKITSPNETEEHIIPNALGGFLKSNKLVLSKINTGLFDRLDGYKRHKI